MSDTENREQAEAHKFPRIVQFVRETPWALLESKLLEIRQMVELHVSGHRLSPEEIQARIGAGPARRDAYQTSGSVAVIPIYGVITPKADLMTEMSGGTSIDRLQQSLRAAVADDKVKSILFDVNSPGGSVAMLNEMAGEIRQARRVKPVVAIANTMAGSAAYQLASQASEFVVTPSGSVGSIGTIAIHEDISAALDQQGVKTTTITAGKYKAELSPLAPLSEDAKAQMQATVDKYYAMFVQDVARGRGVTVETVRADYGQGRMLLAKDALAAGMVDRVDTFDSVLASMEKNGGTVSRQGPLSLTTSVYLDGKSIAEAVVAAASDELHGVGAAIAQASENFEPPPKPIVDTQDPEAAFSGLSFADEADGAPDALEAFAGRLTSLAEVKRGVLTNAKRDQVTACRDRVSAAVDVLTSALDATDPDKSRSEFVRAAGAFELDELQRQLEGVTK